MSVTLYLPPSDIHVDNAHNLSRAGLAHDPTAIREMADRLLALGQLSPIEVVAPEGWDPEEWALCVSEHGIGPVTCGEHVDRVATPGRLVFGFRRVAAATLLAVEGKTSPRWDGRLKVTVAPAGLSLEELEDRNLTENLGLTMAYVDLGLAAHHLIAAPEDGGRGEDPAAVAVRLKVDRAELGRLLLLPGLCDEARALSREHHHNPERGMTPLQALKLAKRPVELQRSIIAEARDAGHMVTPKAMRAAALFGRIARCEDPTLRDGLDPAAATVIHDVLLALVAGEATALARLPGSLGKRLEAAILREPER